MAVGASAQLLAMSFESRLAMRRRCDCVGEVGVVDVDRDVRGGVGGVGAAGTAARS